MGDGAAGVDDFMGPLALKPNSVNENFYRVLNIFMYMYIFK